jgi:hypothetical protein
MVRLGHSSSAGGTVSVVHTATRRVIATIRGCDLYGVAFGPKRRSQESTAFTG